LEPPKQPGSSAPIPPAVTVGQTPAEQLEALKKGHDKLEKWFSEALRAAKDQQANSKANQEYQQSNKEFQERLLALAQAFPSNPVAFESILTVIKDVRWSLTKEMLDIVTRLHLENPKLGVLCLALMYEQPNSLAEGFLKQVAAKNANRAARGLALYALGKQAQLQLGEWNRQLREADRPKFIVEAQRIFTSVEKDYSNVALPDSHITLGEKAASELARLKNLAVLKVGRVAPEIVGKDVEGRSLRLSDYRGKIVLLDFWGNW